MPPSLKRHLLPVWCALLALLVLAPALAPGYVLRLDMVFVPHQTLLPWNLGIGGGLPRSVPQDAVVSVISGPLAGQVLQKAVLFGSLLAAGLGAARLAGGSVLRQAASASVYLWSAYVAARLMMGHWALLWAYGLLPWVVVAARTARTRGRWAPVAFLCGVGALVPTAGVILAVAGVPLAAGFASRMRTRMRVVLVAVVLVLNAPWWLPALRSGVAGVSDPLGLVVFGSRADGVGGVLWSVLAGGGVWNPQATLGSRTTAMAAFGVLLLLVLAALGARDWLSAQRPEAIWLGILGVAGVLWAWLSGVADSQGWAQSIVSLAPGGGLLRDGQKWTIFWVLVLAMTAPRGLQRITRNGERSLRMFLAVAMMLFPLALLPDLAWGGFGRLRTASYPDSWPALRTFLADDARAGDVLSLPWAPFRRYAWNHGGVVLDPLPRYLTRTVVWNDDLPVALDGGVTMIGGDDPRAAVVSAAIDSGGPLGPELKSLGIRWVVVQTDQPAVGVPPDLEGTRLVWADDGFEVREVRGDIDARTPRDVVVVFADLLALGVLVGTGIGTFGPRIRGFLGSVSGS